MIDRKARCRADSLPKWKSHWPSNGEPRSWFTCGIRKCEEISDDKLACDKAGAFIDALGRVGGSVEATKAVDRLIKRVPSNDGNHWYRSLAMSGATAAYNGGDAETMEKYLALVAGQNKYLTRPCDLNYPLKQVADFKIRHGLLEPTKVDESGRTSEAIFTWHYRLLKATGSRKARGNHLAQMENAVQGIQGEFYCVKFHQELLQEYARLGDDTALKRIKRGLSKELATKVLDYPTLWGIGEVAKAVKDVKKAIKSKLVELAQVDDPNIHFPVCRILSAIRWLVRIQEIDVAKAQFQLVRKSVPKWHAFEGGWITAGVNGYLGEMAMAVDDIDSAREFVYAGLRISSAGKSSTVVNSVQSSLLKLLCSIGMFDEALGIAQGLRSPKHKRLNIARILVRTNRWKQLKEICMDVKSVEEAVDLAWWLRFEVSGGEP